MAIKTRSQLKQLYETGDIPSEIDFSDLLDSVVLREDDITAYILNGGNEGENLSAGTSSAHYFDLITNATERMRVHANGRITFGGITDNGYDHQFISNSFGLNTDTIDVNSSGSGNVTKYIPSVNNSAIHKLAFSYYNSGNIANAIVAKSSGAFGNGSIEVWATSVNGANASSPVFSFGYGTYAESAGFYNKSYLPFHVGDLRVDGLPSDGKRIYVRSDMPIPSYSNMAYCAGDATYQNRAGGDSILEGGGNAGNGAGGHAVLRASLSSASSGVTNAKTDVLRAMANDNIRLQLYGDVGSATSAQLIAGTGTPEGVVTATVGCMFLRTDGGAGTTLYVKETGSGNTGWVAK